MSRTAQNRRVANGGALPARDGRDDADGLAVGDRGVETLEEADVVIGDEHVDEPPEATRVVEEPLREAGVRRLEAREDLADRGALDRDLGGTSGEGAEGGGHSDGDAHRSCSGVGGPRAGPGQDRRSY